MNQELENLINQYPFYWRPEYRQKVHASSQILTANLYLGNTISKWSLLTQAPRYRAAEARLLKEAHY
ncbi:uncharacterized protein RCO7_14988 [Rhynchosporium graminicola]|uniref:Uncharacterized protein n=1 Tax=Rhynchosporium graminicola TaxID=2792576 RepID=A0A1E1LED0_9HELO|nr:uncharacterized protein RCO7_14988 [Rhynchosporium commune]